MLVLFKGTKLFKDNRWWSPMSMTLLATYVGNIEYLEQEAVAKNSS